MTKCQITCKSLLKNSECQKGLALSFLGRTSKKKHPLSNTSIAKLLRTICYRKNYFPENNPLPFFPNQGILLCKDKVVWAAKKQTDCPLGMIRYLWIRNGRLLGIGGLWYRAAADFGGWGSFLGDEDHLQKIIFWLIVIVCWVVSLQCWCNYWSLCL